MVEQLLELREGIIYHNALAVNILSSYILPHGHINIAEISIIFCVPSFTYSLGHSILVAIAGSSMRWLYRGRHGCDYVGKF